jgi:hypothetical protein
MTAPLRHEVDVSRAKYLPAPTFERLLNATLFRRVAALMRCEE